MERIGLIISIITGLVYLLGGFRWAMNEWRLWRNKGKWLAILLLWFLPSTVEAFDLAYPVTSCTVITADASSATVQAAITAAGANDTVCVAAGAAAWADFSVNLTGRHIALVGAAGWGGGTTTITGGAPYIGSVTGSADTRVTGFTFLLGGVNSKIQFVGATRFRIDHNVITKASHDDCIYGWGEPLAPMYGLVDHNTFTNCRISYFGEANDTGGRYRWSEPLDMGTDNALYVEDNSLTEATFIGNFIDGNMGARTVVRFNTTVNVYTEVHSIQGYSIRGQRLFEFYGNDLTQTTHALRTGLFRAGTGMLFHNLYHGTDWPAVFHFDNVRSCDDARDFSSWGHCSAAESSFPDANEGGKDGALCRDQPGASTDASLWNTANPAPAQTKQPYVMWKNTIPSTIGEIPFGHNTCGTSGSLDARLALQIVENRDVYTLDATVNAAIPQTTGVREGTLAQRPASCTTGVYYWATDQGSWNTSTSNPYGVQQNGADGLLYQCTSTDTWTLFYTPYTYPHPLQGVTSPPVTSSIPTSVSVGRVLRWMEVLMPILGLGFHFRRVLLATCLAAIACTSTVSLTMATQTKVLSKQTALKTLTVFNHLTRPRR